MKLDRLVEGDDRKPDGESPVLSFSVKNVESSEVTSFFLNDPKLAYLGLSDEELALLYKTGQHINTTGSNIFGVYEKDELVCIVKYEMYTTEAANIHLYVKSGYHHTQKTWQMGKFVRDLFKKTGMLKLILTVPHTCKHIQKFAPRLGFVQEGRITKCCKWREQVVDLIIYSLDLHN